MKHSTPKQANVRSTCINSPLTTSRKASNVEWLRRNGGCVSLVTMFWLHVIQKTGISCLQLMQLSGRLRLDVIVKY